MTETLAHYTFFEFFSYPESGEEKNLIESLWKHRKKRIGKHPMQFRLHSLLNPVLRV
jgi:hypothetical protein